MNSCRIAKGLERFPDGVASDASCKIEDPRQRRIDLRPEVGMGLVLRLPAASMSATKSPRGGWLSPAREPHGGEP